MKGFLEKVSTGGCEILADEVAYAEMLLRSEIVTAAESDLYCISRRIMHFACLLKTSFQNNSLPTLGHG